MPKNRTLSPEFWTREAVIDCAPLTRLLFLGMTNFADDFGVQPLKPRTIRLQVLPGDAIDDAALRAMIEELEVFELVRVYRVNGQDYVAILGWDQFCRIGKHARRRYPAQPSAEGMDKEAEKTSTTAAEVPVDSGRTQAAWTAAIGARLREAWPDGPPIEAMEQAETERLIDQWIAEGCDLERDVLTAISAASSGPLAGLHELADAVNANRNLRMAA
jgi:hypothetical protein